MPLEFGSNSAKIKILPRHGCADWPERLRGYVGNAAQCRHGALGGAVGGALIGKATGSDKVGRDAAIGAGLGALGGYVVAAHGGTAPGHEPGHLGTGVEVTRTSDDQLKLEIPSDISFDVGRRRSSRTCAPSSPVSPRPLKDNPGATIRIVGHTDSTGEDSVNRPLSLGRAMSARDFLVDRGVAARIGVAGRGEQEPVASNATEAGRAKTAVSRFRGRTGRRLEPAAMRRNNHAWIEPSPR